MFDNADVIILGGGCAGLSLATRLASLGGTCPRVIVLEGRAAYTHDRTWCFFKDPQAPVQHSVQHAWPSMRITSGTGSVTVDCGSMPYEMVHAGQFYNCAQSIINQSDHVDLVMDVTITKAPEKRDGRWKVDTGVGAFHAPYVIDTRPAKRPERDGAKLWQSFYGQEIECNVDTFDASCGDLMDFSAAIACGAEVAFPDAVSFVYVLPTTARRALLEFTVFGPDPLNPDLLHDLLAKAVKQRVGSAEFSVLRSEHGVLPMGTLPSVSSHDASYVLAGLTAGGARPSSGYAFARIQRWAASCADALASGQGPVGHAADGFVLSVMDALFLKLVRAYPQAAPDLFAALFAGTDTASLIRFLSDRATLADNVRVAAALLPRPLLRALASRTRQNRSGLPLLKAQ